MAKRGNITVKIDGEYNDKDINRAIRDLNRLKTESGGAAASAGYLGGQMRDLGKSLVGAFAIVGIVGALKSYTTGAVEAALESERTNDRLEQIARSMGVLYGQLGGTTQRLEDYASSLQDATGISDETVKSGQAILLTFKNLASSAGEAGGMFDRATAALLDLSASGFGDATTNAKSLGKALQDPIKGITALGRQGITFTEQEKDKIKALVESNRLHEAQGIIMASVEQQVGGAAAAMATDFDDIRVAADEAQEMIGGALVRAAENAVTAFGGTGGLSSSIEDASTNVTNFIDGIGLLIVELGKLRNIGSDNDYLEEAWSWLGKYGPQNMIPGWSLIPGLFDMIGEDAAKATGRTEALSQALIDGTLSQRMIAEAIKGGTGALSAQDIALDAAADSADEAKAAVDALRAAQQNLNNVISDAKALIDYRRYLHDIDEELKGNERTFKGHSDAVRENQDYLIAGFEQARVKVEQWARDGKIGADEVERAFAGRAKKIVQAFVDDGFELSDIRKFLKSSGLWTAEMAALFDPSANQSAYDKAYAAGKRLGKNLGDGVKVGIVDPESVRGVTASAMRLIAQAEAAARAAAESHSPSMLFARVGEDLSKGLAKGVKDASGAVAESAKEIVKSALDAARSEVDAAQSAMSSVSDSIVSQVLGNVGFSTTDAEGNALTPEQIMASILGSAANQRAAVDAIAANVGAALPPALLQQMLSMEPETAIALANYLGGAEGSAMLAQLTTNYAELSTATESLLGKPMGAAWAIVGDKAAKDMLIAARATIADLSPGFASFVRRQLSTTIDIGVNLSGSGIPGRAMGGPVSAGEPYFVGERGVELFVPNESGSIVPNHRAAAAPRSTVINITVNAPVGGDLRRAGQDIAEALAAYERGSGPIYVKAS